jgi:hypothetical protein
MTYSPRNFWPKRTIFYKRSSDPYIQNESSDSIELTACAESKYFCSHAKLHTGTAYN